jgi:hypothetical protein
MKKSYECCNPDFHTHNCSNCAECIGDCDYCDTCDEGADKFCLICIKVICECGAVAISSPKHSNWCPAL